MAKFHLIKTVPCIYSHFPVQFPRYMCPSRIYISICLSIPVMIVNSYSGESAVMSKCSSCFMSYTRHWFCLKEYFQVQHQEPDSSWSSSKIGGKEQIDSPLLHHLLIAFSFFGSARPAYIHEHVHTEFCTYSQGRFHKSLFPGQPYYWSSTNGIQSTKGFIL